jgi:hypothetical protein
LRHAREPFYRPHDVGAKKVSKRDSQNKGDGANNDDLPLRPF